MAESVTIGDVSFVTSSVVVGIVGRLVLALVRRQDHRSSATHRGERIELDAYPPVWSWRARGCVRRGRGQRWPA